MAPFGVMRTGGHEAGPLKMALTPGQELMHVPCRRSPIPTGGPGLALNSKPCSSSESDTISVPSAHFDRDSIVAVPFSARAERHWHHDRKSPNVEPDSEVAGVPLSAQASKVARDWAP
jgi:hypothetical protein